MASCTGLLLVLLLMILSFCKNMRCGCGATGRACLVLALSIVIIVLFILRTATFRLDRLTDLLINVEIISPKYGTGRQGSITMKRGMAVMRSSSVSIVGIGRDVEPRLPGFLSQIESLAQRFNTSRAIFLEGRSKDQTAKLLTQWAALSNSNRSVITDFYDEDERGGPFDKKGKPREGRLAVARNKILEVMREMPSPTHFVIVVDLDIVGFDPLGVADSFANSRMWDVVCANGIMLHGVYRDTFAFRAEGGNTTNPHWWDQEINPFYNASSADRRVARAQYDRTIHALRQQLDFSTQGFTRVDSCFGGMSIYRSEVLLGCEYSHRYPDPPYMAECEHVLLHHCIREKNQARIFSNARMKLWYGHGFGCPRGQHGLSCALRRVRQVANV